MFAVFLGLVGFWPMFHGRPGRVWALGLSVMFGLLAWGRPSLLYYPNLWWSRLGLLMGTVVNPVVLGIMFFLVFTPFGFVLRLLKKDPLRLRLDPGADSYWLPRRPPGPTPETMPNQF